MDYDTTGIAATYDAARGYPPEVMEQWLDIIAGHMPPDSGLLIDLGCGTGRFTVPLAERFKARVIGIDPSERMLEVARRKMVAGRVEFRQARGERLPVDDGVADLVFLSMVLHHLDDPASTARECRRVLRDGGRVCVRNGTRETEYPQRRFFPGIVTIIEAELPSREEVIELFEAAGLKRRAHELVPHPLAANWNQLADKLALRADSFLARLADADFEAGLAALRAYASGRPSHEQITEQIDLFVFQGCHGVRPAGSEPAIPRT
jgi:ubiquinone/menaquinone biosynthesis C-methylase UbiE